MLLKRNLLGITLFSLIISLICFCLSNWQVKRLFWKSDLINSLELAYKSSPANINNLYADLQEFKYKKILVEGTFINKNMYLEPRTYNGQVGFNLISPFLRHTPSVFIISPTLKIVSPIRVRFLDVAVKMLQSIKFRFFFDFSL
mgnify:CR=1 FL=1